MTRIQLAKAAAVVALSASLLAAGVTLGQPPAKVAGHSPRGQTVAGPTTPNQLQGTWLRVSTETGGRVRKADVKQPFHLVVRGDQFAFGGEGKGIEKFAIVPGSNPAGIALTPQGEAAGPIKGKTYCGICKVDGDTLTLCLIIGTRGLVPTEFTTKPGDGRVQIVYTRVLPKAGKQAEAPVNTDQEQPQGG